MVCNHRTEDYCGHKSGSLTVPTLANLLVKFYSFFATLSTDHFIPSINKSLPQIKAHNVVVILWTWMKHPNSSNLFIIRACCKDWTLYARRHRIHCKTTHAKQVYLLHRHLLLKNRVYLLLNSNNISHVDFVKLILNKTTPSFRWSRITYSLLGSYFKSTTSFAYSKPNSS